MPGFQILKEQLENKIVLLTIQGFLDAHTFEQMEKVINDLFESNQHRLIVDLAGLDYISSAGAGVFIAALSESEENGGKIVLLNPTTTVMDVFDLLGLTQIFTMATDRQEAVDALNN